ncbi:MAG: nucleoside monophosphate kinase [bacterium]|nr:nucleoside monophosphate kinase [bacterium]
MSNYIIFFGPPASGKGTQANRLAKELAVSTISIGDIIRNEISRSTATGTEIKKYVLKGELVPDEIVINIFNEKIKRPEFKDGFISDGYPRSLRQAKELKSLNEIEQKMVFFF